MQVMCSCKNEKVTISPSSYQLKPPLVPPRGEVNAADAFDIGSFDEDDVKGIKLSDADQEIYTAFNHVNSERWQQEIAGVSFISGKHHQQQ
jgi:hypothetical protein